MFVLLEKSPVVCECDVHVVLCMWCTCCAVYVVCGVCGVLCVYMCVYSGDEACYKINSDINS